MSTTAPKPPTKRLFASALLSAGLTGGMVVVTSLGHFVFSGGIPRERLAVYVVLIAAGIATTGWLGGRYLIQRHRRDAWWDGFSVGDEPEAEVIQLHGIKNPEGKARKFIAGQPS